MVLPPKVLLLVYALPVVMSFFLHLALHHNVLFERTWTRTAGLLISVLSPIMYMVSCAESQLEYWPVKHRSAIALALGRAKLVGSVLVFVCMQNHPLLRDLKAFSGLQVGIAYHIPPHPLTHYNITSSTFVSHKTPSPTYVLLQGLQSANGDGRGTIPSYLNTHTTAPSYLNMHPYLPPLILPCTPTYPLISNHTPCLTMTYPAGTDGDGVGVRRGRPRSHGCAHPSHEYRQGKPSPSPLQSPLPSPPPVKEITPSRYTTNALYYKYNVNTIFYHSQHRWLDRCTMTFPRMSCPTPSCHNVLPCLPPHI